MNITDHSMTITDARIVPGPYGQSKVLATPNNLDEFEYTLFVFYPDELSFSASEFIGLSEDEALAIFTRKDIAYLRS